MKKLRMDNDQHRAVESSNMFIDLSQDQDGGSPNGGEDDTTEEEEAEKNLMAWSAPGGAVGDSFETSISLDSDDD